MARPKRLCFALIAAQATALMAPKSPLITVAKTLPLAAALAAPAAALSTSSPLVAAWDRGAGACEMRPIVQSAALPHLLKLLSHAKKAIRKESCWTISNITAGNRDQIQEVINNGLIPPVIALLQTGDF